MRASACAGSGAGKRLDGARNHLHLRAAGPPVRRAARSAFYLARARRYVSISLAAWPRADDPGVCFAGERRTELRVLSPTRRRRPMFVVPFLSCALSIDPGGIRRFGSALPCARSAGATQSLAGIFASLRGPPATGSNRLGKHWPTPCHERTRCTQRKIAICGRRQPCRRGSRHTSRTNDRKGV